MKRFGWSYRLLAAFYGIAYLVFVFSLSFSLVLREILFFKSVVAKTIRNKYNA